VSEDLYCDEAVTPWGSTSPSGALRWFDPEEIRQLVRASEIRDGRSLTALCRAMALGVVGDGGHPRWHPSSA
jgi:hypothetical protein